MSKVQFIDGAPPVTDLQQESAGTEMFRAMMANEGKWCVVSSGSNTIVGGIQCARAFGWKLSHAKRGGKHYAKMERIVG